LSNQHPRLKLAVISWLYGDKTVGRLLCYYLQERDIRTVVLAGNTVSPSLIEWLSEKCGAVVLGVIGNLDDTSVASALASKGFLLETKSYLVDNLRLTGLGLTATPMEYTIGSTVEATVLVSFLNGRLHKCCSGSSASMVDEVSRTVKANLVVTGSCPSPCVNERTMSPGFAYLGWVGVIEYSAGYFNIEFENLRKSL